MSNTTPPREFLASVFFTLAVLSSVCAAAEIDGGPEVSGFLRSNCLDCHQGDEAEAGLNLSEIDADWSDPQTREIWVRMHDRVAAGEMPPADYSELDSKQRLAFLAETSAQISTAERQEFARLGRVRSRRLTNLQVERTLHDLLAIDLPLADLLPEEPRSGGFQNQAEGQSISHFLMESHLRVVDAALDGAMQRAIDPLKPQRRSMVRQYTARRLARENPRQRCRDPEMIDGSAVVWSSGLIFYGRITSTTVSQSGWYRIDFSASAVNPPKEQQGVWCSVRSGRCNSGAPLMAWIGSFEAKRSPANQAMLAWIPEGHMIEIRPADATLRRAKFRGGQVGAGEGAPQNVPGLALHSMRIEQVHPGGDVEQVRSRLFGDMSIEISRESRAVRYVGKEPLMDTVAQLRQFTRRAFRRPVSDEQFQPYRDWLVHAIEDGEDPIDALLASYRAVLCSPRFLYLVETPGPLDDHAIACRLSYLLWNRMPDDELLRLAEDRRLRDHLVLNQQVVRMLNQEKGKRFVSDFASQWLDLIDIDFTEPDRKLYRNFDMVVQNSMLDETNTFLQSLLDENAPVTRLIDANHTFLNSRLARYYEIDGVEGDSLRKVKLDRDTHRGGLLAHGSILKVTANGTNTSPILRGVWISERILGTPIPPPPENVPAVEPDVRGAKTIREQLQLHLADPSCARCHDKIDPPGYALEHFDAAGRWRDAYQRVKGGRSSSGSRIDSSFTFSDGRSFENYDEFRNLIGSRPKQLAKNFAEQLMVYGTGAPICFADRDGIDQIIDRCSADNYGLQSILKAVITSPLFLSK